MNEEILHDEIIARCAKECDSFYLYDERTILESIHALKAAFPQVEFLYSIKCNPNEHILNSIFSQGFGADAASAGEVGMARGAGLPASKIFYSAPGKSAGDIESAVDQAMIIADSLNEIARLQAIAASSGRVVKTGLRVNPNFSFEGDCGQASKFGIDEEQALEFARSNPYQNVKVVGLHVHLKSQVLNADALATHYKRILRLAERFTNAFGPLEYLNMGSGIGIRYAPTDSAMNMAALSQSVRNSLDAFHAAYPNTRLMMEVGRYAVGKSGMYVTKVMDRKVSCGKTYLILKNTLNGFIRPSLEKLVERYSPEQAPAMAEPLFTCKNAFELIPLKQSNSTETVTLVGNLCTATDVIAEDVTLPKLECGDLLAITNAGSYAAALSPMQFSSHEKPREYFLRFTGEVLTAQDESGVVEPMYKWYY